MADSGLNLTRAAYLGRQTIKFGAIVLVALIVGRFSLTAAVNFWNAMNPKPPPPPTVGFGILPPVRFPLQSSSDKPEAYDLQVPQSRFNNYGDRAKVFLMLHSSIGLFTDQRAKEVAANYGFMFTPTILSDTQYRWTKTQPLQATLEMNIVDLTFELKTDYLSRAELLRRTTLPNQAESIKLVKSFINTGQSLPSDFATSAGEMKYLKSVGGELEEAVAISDADFVQVDIRRAPVDGKFPFFTPKGYHGAVHAILTSALPAKDQIVDLTYNHQPVDYAERHTYPLRSLSSASEVLQAGEAYIVNKGSFETAVIRDVQLGYYDDDREQDYMQPIYVFEGDGGFMAYVPALQPQYYQTDQVTPEE